MKVDFYLLENASQQRCLHFACQLIEKAYQAEQRLYVHTPSREQAERLDALLWTYRDDSFIPHQLYPPLQEPIPAIQIGFHEAPKEPADLLLNLSHEVPDFFKQYPHIIEIVFSEADMQQLARLRYKHYREQGCEITTHKLKANEI